MSNNSSHNPSLYESAMIIPGMERVLMPRSPKPKQPKPAKHNAAAMASQTTLVSESSSAPLGKQPTEDSLKTAASPAEDRPNMLKRLLRKASP